MQGLTNGSAPTTSGWSTPRWPADGAPATTPRRTAAAPRSRAVSARAEPLAWGRSLLARAQESLAAATSSSGTKDDADRASAAPAAVDGAAQASSPQAAADGRAQGGASTADVDESSTAAAPGAAVNGRAAAEAHAGGSSESETVQEARRNLGDGEVLVTTHTSIEHFTEEEWDACVHAAAEVNPFLRHAFFAALEHSGSATAATGWLAQHVALRNNAGKLLAAAPLYAKSHSYGEYVFDNSWAGLFAQLGHSYYPKLQCCVPFTPVTGSRVLIAPGEDAGKMRAIVLRAMLRMPDVLKMSSIHITFNTEEDWKTAAEVGWMNKVELQFHWENDNYKTFDDFLAALKQGKRKSIRQERKSIGKQGLRVERLTGASLTEDVWDKFFEFYEDTTDRKWGQAYLTRSFFHRLGASMADHVLLVVAYDDNRGGELVAGALNLIGSHALFGRNWGCRAGAYYKNLHFELCYYQAIEAAIEMGLDRVEAGAQGQHKISRGYLPSPTYSSHHVTHPMAAGLIRRSLRANAARAEEEIEALALNVSPFKQDTGALDEAFSQLRQRAAAQSRE